MDIKDQILELTNDKKRKDFVLNWMNWPVWVWVPELHLRIHRLDLPDGSAICCSIYEGAATKILYGPRKGTIDPCPIYCIIPRGEKFKPGSAALSTRAEHVMEIRKQLLGRDGADE